VNEEEWVLRLLGRVLRYEEEHASGAECIDLSYVPEDAKIAAATYDQYVTKPYAEPVPPSAPAPEPAPEALDPEPFECDSPTCQCGRFRFEPPYGARFAPRPEYAQSREAYA
jgi:hypothetical protein